MDCTTGNNNVLYFIAIIFLFYFLFDLFKDLMYLNILSLNAYFGSYFIRF